MSQFKKAKAKWLSFCDHYPVLNTIGFHNLLCFTYEFPEFNRLFEAHRKGLLDKLWHYDVNRLNHILDITKDYIPHKKKMKYYAPQKMYIKKNDMFVEFDLEIQQPLSTKQVEYPELIKLRAEALEIQSFFRAIESFHRLNQIIPPEYYYCDVPAMQVFFANTPEKITYCQTKDQARAKLDMFYSKYKSKIHFITVDFIKENKDRLKIDSDGSYYIINRKPLPLPN